MIDLLGWDLEKALAVLQEQGVKYKIAETYAPKPLIDTDSIRVLRQKMQDDAIELTVGYFKTRI